MAPSTENTDSKINMQGVHVVLTESLKNAIRSKFAPLLRHEEHIVRINVRLHQDQTMGQNHNYTVTAQIEIRGPDVVGHAQGTDAYALIDEVVEKLDAALRRRSGKLKDKRNHPHNIDLEAELPKVGANE